jgi:phosphate transport system substrate-binding protein
VNVRHNPILAIAGLGLVAGLTLSACGGSNGGAASGSGSASDQGGASGQTVSGELNGAGASSAESAQSAWTQNFAATNPEAQVTYDSIGSGKGVEQFLSGGVSFAGTDAALTDEEITTSADACQGGTAFDVPVYISPIAIVYHLEGVDDLQLSPETTAKIFSGKITSWDDPAITKENPDADLPSTKITPVHRSDGSGTTENFTDYLHANAPKAWPDDPAEEWPVDGGQSGDGTSGLVSVVEGGDGTIGYADASKAGNLGIAKIKVGDEYVEYSPEGAAKAVEASPREKGREDGDVVIKLDRTLDDPSTYPLVLVSYLAACDTYEDQATADLVKAYGTYVASEDGQKAAAQVAGNAPLSKSLSEDATASLSKISAKG